MDAFSSTPDGLCGCPGTEVTIPTEPGFSERWWDGTAENLTMTVSHTVSLDALTRCSHLRLRSDVRISSRSRLHAHQPASRLDARRILSGCLQEGVATARGHDDFCRGRRTGPERTSARRRATSR